jgi:peptidoglycan hydrolase-like protein with peptidoglycan-binding domain
VRSPGTRAGRRKGPLVDDEVDGRRGRFVFRALGWRSRDAVAFMVGAFATIAILINMLFMQSGTHPAPMFKSAPAPAKPVATAQSIPAAAPRPRPVEATPAPTPPPKAAAPAAPAAPRTPGEIINDIQRELARRGYYDGAVDGLYGPRTDGAIRDFEQASGLKPSTEPSEALLQTIMRSPAKATKGATVATPAPRPPLPVRNEVAAERPAPSRRVIALQRALAEYGYGQIKPTGVVDADTQAAIEKFERERKLPITGQPSDRVARELAAMTGRPLE